MSYRDTILAGIGRIERAFNREDIESISRADLAACIMDVHDILSDAVVSWYERDEAAETEMKQRIVATLM